MNPFKNKVAIITGGASGIGRELCIELAKRGAEIVVADINSEASDDTVSVIKAMGGTGRSIVTDARDPEAMGRLVKTVAEEGRLDYMFNNAGIIMFGEFRDMPFEEWDRFIDSDLKSVIYGSRFAYDVMIKQGHGHIVNIASVFGIWPFALATGYTAVKQAVVGLTLALRPEAADLGVKVSVACPGSVDTAVRKTYKILNGDRDAFNSFIMKQLSPKKAALKILNGTVRNRGLIAFPFYDLIFWWLFRINPALNYWWQRKAVSLFRKRVRHQESN